MLAQPVPLEVTFNGIQFSEGGLLYTYEQEEQAQAEGSERYKEQGSAR